MCDRHSPSSISRRGVAGLLAAGAGLVSAPLSASAKGASRAAANTLCLMCIDHKFAFGGFEFFHSRVGRDQFDLVALAGASLAGKTPRAPDRRFKFPDTFGALREHLIFAKAPAAKVLHPNIERVIVCDHLRCGAYENEYGAMTPDQEMARHHEVAVEVARWLAAPPLGLKSEFWIIHQQGQRPVKFYEH